MRIIYKFRLWLAQITGRNVAALRLQVRDQQRRTENATQHVDYLVAWLDVLREELVTAKAMTVSLESQLESEREKNQVHQTTITTLVAANNLHLARYERETAIQERARVASLPLAE